MERVLAELHRLRNPKKTCHALPAASRVPVAALGWDHVDVAFYVLSHGLFDPRRENCKPGRHCSDDGLPLVSVCVPTSFPRHAFHDLLLKNFRVQSYKNVELVVVDTGGPSSKPLEKAAQEDPRIRYRNFPGVSDANRDRLHIKKYGYLPEKMYRPNHMQWTLGFKRNLCARLARGSVIAHFDDDDLYAENYLAHMVQELRECVERNHRLQPYGIARATAWWKKPAIATLKEWHCYDFYPDQFRWLSVENCRTVQHEWVEQMVYGFGFSYVYTRVVWEHTRFPDLDSSEDDEFMGAIFERNKKVPNGTMIATVSCPSAPTVALAAHSLHAECTGGGEWTYNFERCGRECRPPSGLEQSHEVAKQVKCVATRKPCMAPVSIGSGFRWR